MHTVLISVTAYQYSITSHPTTFRAAAIQGEIDESGKTLERKAVTKMLPLSFFTPETLAYIENLNLDCEWLPGSHCIPTNDLEQAKEDFAHLWGKLKCGME